MRDAIQHPVVALYNSWAIDGRDVVMEATHCSAFDEMWEQVFENLLLRGRQFTAIDGGCGNAWAARRMADAALCTSVVGVDAAALMIDRAVELSRNHGKVRCCVGNIATWQPEDRADVVSLCETLYLLDNPEAALSHIVRSWLKPVRLSPIAWCLFPVVWVCLGLCPRRQGGNGGSPD